MRGRLHRMLSTVSCSMISRLYVKQLPVQNSSLALMLPWQHRDQVQLAWGCY